MFCGEFRIQNTETTANLSSKRTIQGLGGHPKVPPRFLFFFFSFLGTRGRRRVVLCTENRSVRVLVQYSLVGTVRLLLTVRLMQRYTLTYSNSYSQGAGAMVPSPSQVFARKLPCAGVPSSSPACSRRRDIDIARNAVPLCHKAAATRPSRMRGSICPLCPRRR